MALTRRQLLERIAAAGGASMGQAGRPIGDRSPAERLALAMEQGAKIHPQYPAEFETAFSVAWHRVTWNRGSWSAGGGSPETRRMLSEPQGRIYLCGDHLNMNAWMQGAFESARQVATAIHARSSQSLHRSA